MGAKLSRRDRIKKGIRKRVSGSSLRPRLSVYRSNKGIYAQIIDDVNGKTLVSASSLSKDFVTSEGPKIEQSAAVGKLIAEKAIAAGIKDVVFDRNGYLYHGRVKSLADGAREGGLKLLIGKKDVNNQYKKSKNQRDRIKRPPGEHTTCCQSYQGRPYFQLLCHCGGRR